MSLWIGCSRLSMKNLSKGSGCAMKRFISGLVILTVMLVLSACQGEQKVPAGKDVPVNQQTEKEPGRENKIQNQTGDQTAYYFTDGLLLGSYDKSGWHSLSDINEDYRAGAVNTSDFYAKDLLAVPVYHVYKEQTLIGDARSIIWQTEEDFGLGSFEAEGIKEKFSQYGELYHFEGNSYTSHRIISLPTTLGNELASLKIPQYSFWTYFPIGENWSQNQNQGILVTNSNTINFLSDMKKNVPAKTEVESALKKLFADAGMGNTVFNFTQGFKGDFDGDGREEYVFAANHPNPEENDYWPIIEGEGTKNDVGTFSVLLYQDDDGKIQILHSDLRRFKAGPVTFSEGQYGIMDINHCHTLKVTDIADLNGDGKYEFIIKIGLWEGGYDQVYAQNHEGAYEVVLRSNSGT
ncbi:MAG TPA: hypothetical protein PKN87_06505 [Syntrophomonadaceae bacterium]|nr:hypothetical protein [Syntrophomonadaceae bacterium]HPR92755.1 hypothetical protein [Syntrophomonadaceae bacterium]